MHDYFESHPRYDSYLADVDIPEPLSLWSKPDTWGSIATRGHNGELDGSPQLQLPNSKHSLATGAYSEPVGKADDLNRDKQGDLSSR